MRIDLHLGVHKTATTHLQRHWHQASRTLKITSSCPSLNDVRAKLTPLCGGPAPKAKDGEQPRRDAAAAWVNKLGAKNGRVLLSDENFIGSCAQIFAQQSLYADALPRMLRLATTLVEHEVRVWLSLRDYGSFLRSAYCEVVRHSPYRPFREMYTGVGLDTRGWEHLVREVRQVFPKAEIRCWRYESLDKLRPSLSAELLGVPPKKVPVSDEQRDRKSLSRMAVRLLDDIYQTVGADDATRMRPSVERVISGAGMASFDPWADDERAELSAAYERSIAAVQAVPGVTWLG